MKEFDNMLNDLPKFSSSNALDTRILAALKAIDPDSSGFALDDTQASALSSDQRNEAWFSKTAIFSMGFALVLGVVLGFGNITNFTIINNPSPSNTQTTGEYSDIENFQIIAPEILENYYG